MSKRQVFYVTPDGSDWKVKREGAERASKTFEKKEDAVNYGREKAKNQDLGQVVIHKRTAPFRPNTPTGRTHTRRRGEKQNINTWVIS